MSTALDKIIEEVRHLSPDEQRQLREMLESAQQHTHDTLSPEQQRRADHIRRVRGKYAHITTSSEDFSARKAEEIALEERRSWS